MRNSRIFSVACAVLVQLGDDIPDAAVELIILDFVNRRGKGVEQSLETASKRESIARFVEKAFVTIVSEDEHPGLERELSASSAVPAEPSCHLEVFQGLGEM
jgi:hypothetical protein